MSNAELRQDRVDCPHLNSCAATAIAQLSRLNVVLPVGGEKRQGSEMIDDLIAIAWPREPLKQLLQHQARGDHGVAALEGGPQRTNFGRAFGRVSSEGQRPDTRIDQQGHLRERPPL